MPRRPTINDDDLIRALSDVFRRYGFDGASIATLSKATGLQRASLYHRFPGGKEQMAREVLAATRSWLDSELLAPLRGPGAAEDKIAAMVRSLDRFYAGGLQACLLNLLASPHMKSGPFAAPIKAALEAWIAALAELVAEAGVDAETAQRRAEKAVALIEGSLVLARGMGTTLPFRRCLDGLATELLG